MSVNFQTEWSIPAGSYRLDTLDVVDIEFILDPELDRQVVIRPDGMITLPGIGDVSRPLVCLLKILLCRIEEKLRHANILKNGDMDPRFKGYKMVTVSVSQFYQKIKRLVDSLTTLTSGQQVQIVVKPDGTIDLPMLKDRILAAGHTFPDVNVQ